MLTLHPFRCLGLKYLHKIANSNVWTDGDKHVDMIRYTTYAYKFTLFTFAEAEYIGIEVMVVCLGYGMFTTFSAPYYMVIK